MSRQFTFALCLLLAMLGASPSVTAGEGEPNALLADILSKEFNGDELARQNHVFYSDGKNSVGDCGCSVPRDVWTLDQDSFNIISSWEIIRSKAITSRKYKIDVRFHVIARARRNFQPGWVFGDFRQILVPDKAKDEVISYILVAEGKIWKVQNPPEPRVSPQALRTELKDQVEMETTLRNRAKSENNTKVVSYREAAISGYVSEIDTLHYAILAAGLSDPQ